MSDYFWRLPYKPRKPRPAPSERPPSSRPAPRAPSSRPPAVGASVAFSPMTIAGRAVLVSAEASRLRLSELTQAVAEHGSSPGARESKHRFRSATVMVVSTPKTGERLVATVAELRAMRRGLGTSERSERRRKKGP